MTELKVGILSLATVLAIIFMSFQVTKNQSGFGEYVTYKTVLDDASGIFTKTPIKIAGIPAGRIKKIELYGNKALVTFEVLERVKVTKGSKLKIKAVGFLGDKFLEIEINQNETSRLPEGTMIASSALGGMEGLLDNSNKLLEDLTEIVESVKKSIMPPKEEPPITAILRDIREVLADLKGLTKDTHQIVRENRQPLKSMIQDMRDAMRELAYQLNVRQSDSVMKDIKEFTSASKDFKQMMRDLKEIVANIKAGKGTVGKFLVEEEIADQVKETMASVQKIVGKVDAVKTDLEVFTGYDTESDVTAEFGLQIITSPERFYNVGIITSDIGAKTKTYTETTTNGVRSVEDKVEYKKDTFRFTATMGRWLGNFALRGGLIESTAGFGMDYRYIPWGWKNSLDLFDSRDDIGMNVRFTSELRLWNVFYGRVRANDIAVKATRSFSFSLGLRFSDDDLKSLVGVML